MLKLSQKEIDNIIKLAIKEDIKEGDITTEAVIPKKTRIKAQIRAKAHGVLCGIEIAKRVMEIYDKTVKFKTKRKEGSFIQKNEVVAELEGDACSILAVERIMLNFLVRLSGIATTANKFVEKLLPYKIQLLDTRKTIPGFRALEKYAVKIGGGTNHRYGLYDMFLVKDNHIKIAGSIKKALECISKIKKKDKKDIKAEIEIESLQQLEEVLKLKKLPYVVMLDNLSYEEMEIAVEKLRKKDKKVKIEASGGVTLDNVTEIAKCGVDYISVGTALTLGAEPLDFCVDVIIK